MQKIWLQTLGWQPTEGHQTQFQQLYEQILAGNQQLNLTRITDPVDFWEKHLWDSLRGIQRFLHLDSHSPLPTPLKAIDIGTGAGFPGVPVAIVQPGWKTILLDSTRKKVQFLNHLLEVLNLSNAVPLADRVEAIGQHPNHRETYDVVMVRAVAAATICAEYALPLLKIDGTAVLYRGQWTSEETAVLEPVVQQLGGTIGAIEAFKTPLTGAIVTASTSKKLHLLHPSFLAA